MIINKKRIVSVDRYLSKLGKVKKIYVSVPYDKTNFEILKSKCGIEEYDVGRKIVPSPCGSTTNFNLYGKEIIRKDKEKEIRIVEKAYCNTDWHGVEHTGTYFVGIPRYHRDKIDPPLNEFILDKKNIRSDLIDISEKDNIKTIINMFLEIFSYCELLDEESNPIDNSVKIKRVSWQILPAGKYPWEETRKYYEKYFSSIKKSDLTIIEKRLKFIHSYNHTGIAMGRDSFNGYVVYLYGEYNICIFESNIKNNATYVFKGDWKEVSKLTKNDIIKRKLYYARIIHSSKWEEDINDLFINLNNNIKR